MKTELLSLIQALSDFAASQPEDMPCPPFGLAVASTYGGGGETPLSIELTFCETPVGFTSCLETALSVDGVSGPNGWATIPTSAPTDSRNVRATYSLYPADQAILFRVRFQRSSDGAYSDAQEVAFGS